MAITLASEGEEMNKLKAIVAKTGSVIRVMFALSACLAINPSILHYTSRSNCANSTQA